MIWIEIIKPIHGMAVGHIQQWCDRKAEAVIASGHGKKVKAPKKEKPATAPKRVEVATAPPVAQTADNPPIGPPKTGTSNNIGAKYKSKKK